MSILASTIFLFFGQKWPNVRERKEAVVKNTDSPINGSVNLQTRTIVSKNGEFLLTLCAYFMAHIAENIVFLRFQSVPCSEAEISTSFSETEKKTIS